MGTWAKESDYVGKKYGMLTVLKFIPLSPGERNTKALFRCDCKNEKIMRFSDVKTGRTISCGCYTKTVAHQRKSEYKSKNPRLYKTWASMKQRCLNPNSEEYHNYGGRGISVCEEWIEFIPFADWALSNGYQDDLTIERKDVNGNYCPENCTWATRLQQSRNKRDKKCKSGVSGIYFYPESNKWIARITVNYKRINIGSFNTFEEAVEARRLAKEKYWNENSQVQLLGNSPLMRKDNKSGVRGVHKKGDKWVAGIRINKKKIHLGYHDTLEQAAAARKEAEEKYRA